MAKKNAKPTAAKKSPPSGVMETNVFKTGNSFAVRLPRVLYSGGEAPVYVKKLGDGSLLIVPKRKRKWPAGFLDSFGSMPADFEAPERPAASRADEERDASLFRDDS
jgi:antitoxin component of MazEF toxin-antitoxin module